ncbi:hypothetical protein HOLleu_36004 [Holothuria leucospilota]|uniref:Uncharacterized protein n=1 Tax=Holothuria leucospilota TaxID=206669 RepID=A0A9Q1BG97_HOLLE|nr:hypothetical protein HOLleu_36004 [Holothuria leucospilota]
MSKELKDFVEQSEICNQFCTEQAKEPLIQHLIPSRPWEKIGVTFLPSKTKTICVLWIIIRMCSKLTTCTARKTTKQ